MRSLTKNLSRSGAKSSTLDFVESADQQRETRKFNAAAAKTQQSRVGWSLAMNVGRATPEQAWKVMENTADSAKLLKEANGIKAGKATSKPVYHYSITWPEADAPTNALQKKAVAESLRVLGMHDHEAIAVQHLDGKPHVHVMVNLIHPETGMSASTSVEQANGKKASKLTQSRKKLRDWATRFEKTHGLQITEGVKRNAEKRAQGEQVNARRKNRAAYEREKREKRAEMMGWFIKQQKDKGHQIGKRERERQQDRGLAWAALFASVASPQQGIAANANQPGQNQTVSTGWAATSQSDSRAVHVGERGDQAVSRSSRHHAKTSGLKVGWTQTIDVLDFVKAYKSLERREQEERAEDRQMWRSYGDGRTSEFAAIVESGEQASERADRSLAKERGEGLGRELGRFPT